MREEIINIDKAIPASRQEVLLWLLTGGKKGRLFTAKKTQMSKWYPIHTDLRCRCATTVISSEDGK